MSSQIIPFNAITHEQVHLRDILHFGVAFFGNEIHSHEIMQTINAILYVLISSIVKVKSSLEVSDEFFNNFFVIPKHLEFAKKISKEVFYLCYYRDQNENMPLACDNNVIPSFDRLVFLSRSNKILFSMDKKSSVDLVSVVPNLESFRHYAETGKFEKFELACRKHPNEDDIMTTLLPGMTSVESFVKEFGNEKEHIFIQSYSDTSKYTLSKRMQLSNELSNFVERERGRKPEKKERMRFSFHVSPGHKFYHYYLLSSFLRLSLLTGAISFTKSIGINKTPIYNFTIQWKDFAEENAKVNNHIPVKHCNAPFRHNYFGFWQNRRQDLTDILLSMRDFFKVITMEDDDHLMSSVSFKIE